MRRYDEVVAVEGAADASGEPARFLWRGRLYIVRGVLAHWVELGAWWRKRDREGLPVRIDGGGREVWRVAARAGRTSAEGVYDLAYDESDRVWSLTHALD
jgi:hypothetical protein